MNNCPVDFTYCLSSYWDTFMPAPHCVLLKGLTIGVDDLRLIPFFKQALINTGTVHVAVVSGYNISLVVSSCKTVLGNKVSYLNILTYIVLSLGYSILTGFEPPIVRAWIMSSITLIATLSGRVINVFYVLFMSCLVMLLFDKSLLNSYSFILSSGATMGLILYGTGIKKYLEKHIKVRLGTLLDDLSASLAASLIVAPYIAFSFSRVSYFSVFINMLVLWTIPYATLFGFIEVLLTLIDVLFGTGFSPVFFIIIYPFLDIFIRAINFFGSFKFISGPVQVTLSHLAIYYLILLVVTLRRK